MRRVHSPRVVCNQREYISCVQVDKMVNSCCVKDCYNTQKPGRENDRRYFQVLAVVCGKGEETFQLTSRRRREWLAQLKLKGLTFESTARRFVCSDHFVSGK
ncbi:hypothetical protein BaRGS_00023237 [Batillaria attramentaria]|uniref:THAP-type domain-containing protein n=1 Tax=Batillaria attramentaria TaxID=370345 RepID=A0ABD0KEL1_9CAEN